MGVHNGVSLQLKRAVENLGKTPLSPTKKYSKASRRKSIGRIRPALLAGLAALLVTAAPAAAGQAASGALELPPAPPEVIRYNAIRTAIYFGSTAWELLGLGLIVALRLGPRLKKRATGLTRSDGFMRGLVHVLVIYAGITLALALWRLPVSVLSWQVERAFGFSTMSAGLFAGDRLRGWLFGLIYAPAAWAGYTLMARRPRDWWLWLWAASIPFLLAVTVLAPVLIDTAYHRFRPLPDSPLRTRLVALAEKAGIENAEVLVADYSRRTTKLNAYVTGIGPTKRMVIWDTTLKALTEDEIVAIMGHEIGHYVLRHVWWSFAAGTLASFGIFWLLAVLLRRAVKRWGARFGIAALHDPGGLPLALLFLTLTLFLQTPLESAFSRWQERQADAYGLQLTGLREATARAFIAFAKRNYADPDPPTYAYYWFYMHPPLRERVQSALRPTD